MTVPTPWTLTSFAAGLVAAAVAPWCPVPRRWPLWIVGIAAVALVLNVMIALRRGLPEPRVHDEFSYLLAADTFARGRLAEPTPPAWAAVQTFHVLVRPAYASKYPPGQGLVLSIGQVTTGMPIVGAWLAAAILAAAAGWAAAGLLPAAWAVGVAVVVALHPQVIEWSQTYWGGSVAAVGGALVLGGWARQSRAVSARGAAALGVGLGLLLVTRPYEGAAFAAAFGVDLIVRRPPAKPGAKGRWVAWVVVGLLPFVVLDGAYNAAVTGRPWRLPYLVYEQQYAAAPPLIVERPRLVPAGVPAEMAAYAEHVELPHFNGQRTVRGFATTAVEKLRFLATAALPSPWAWPLTLLVPWALVVDRRLRVVAFALVATLAATVLSNWTRTQYVAAATAAVAVLLAGAAARVPRVGRSLWAAAVVGTATLTFAPVPPGPRFQRDALAASLAAEPARQLVLVHYGPGHRLDDEWVYNGADPASAKVVWARGDVLPEAAVRAAYPGRTVWHLDVTGTAAAVRRE